MKSLLTALGLLSGLFTLAQHATETQTAPIRAAVEKINNGSGYTTKRLKEEDFTDQTSDNGSEIKTYFKDGKLLKIVEEIGLSSCTNTIEYYFDKERLIRSILKGTSRCGGEPTVQDAKEYLEDATRYRKWLSKGKSPQTGKRVAG